MRNRLMAVLAVLMTGLALVPPAMGNGNGEPAAACTPYFPLKDGWLGGDAAYSVPLSDGRMLWLFGDTFIGRPGARDRKDATLVGNSIALSACRDGEWRLDYAWRQGDGLPEAMFVPPDAHATTHEVRYWPLDGFVHDGVLYVFLSRVRTTDADDPLGFAIEGVDMARVEGLHLSPADWRITYLPVLRGVPALPGTAVLNQEKHVLLYAPLTGEAEKDRPVALARLPLDGLGTPQVRLQYLARDGGWADGFDPARAQRIMDKGSTELSVHEEKGDGRFVAVLNESAFPSDRVVLRTAPAPEGPWTEDFAVELIAERAPGEKAPDPRLFCYAAKAYEPGTAGATLMLIYICNSTEADLLLNDMSIYRPRTRRVTLPRVP